MSESNTLALLLIQRLLSKLGVTRAVSWTLMTQGIRLLTGPATMFLMIRYLSADMQGYAYTFGSVLAVSIFLEMGFSQNILQFASHEYSKLEFNSDHSLSGEARAYSRLISLGRLSFKYYGVATVLFFIVLMVGGNWFFSTSHDVGVSWGKPWVIVSVTSALSLFLNPCWALLEGCNKISEVEKFRFYSSLASFAGLALGLLLGFGLYAVCFPSLISATVSLGYVLLRWRSFFAMFMAPPSGEAISWRNEIWPFQWRIAVSWMCGYFIFSIITPVVFRLEGPTAAGRVGFTLQLARMIAAVASSWSTTRLPEFGILVARRDWENLRSIWKKSAVMSLAVTAAGSLAMIIGMEILCRIFPNIAARYSGWIVASLFCSSMIIQSIISSFAYYLRAFKEEPYMILSIANAVISFGLVVIMAIWWNEIGAAFGYMLSILIIFPAAWYIFSIKSRQFRDRSDS